jgi:hypothetical protein
MSDTRLASVSPTDRRKVDSSAFSPGASLYQRAPYA